MPDADRPEFQPHDQIRDGAKSPSRIRANRVGDVVSATAAAVKEGTGRAAARTVRGVIEHTRRAGTDVRAAASHILSSRGPDGGSGAFGQAAGHAFERMDAAAYNARNGLTRKQIQLVKDSRHGVYDGIRKIQGRPAGAIQYKLSGRHADRAIRKMNEKLAGSSSKATLRVPQGEGALARQAARGQTRVSESVVRRKDVTSTVERGAQRLSKLGVDGGPSLARAAGRAAGLAAIGGVAIGAGLDARSLMHGKLTANEFWHKRVEDAADAGTGAACTSLLTAMLAATSASPILIVGGGIAAASVTGMAARKGVQAIRSQFGQEPPEALLAVA